MITIVCWLILCVLIGLLGRNRKIGFMWSFLLCLVLSPLIGLIFTLFSKKKGVEFSDVN